MAYWPENGIWYGPAKMNNRLSKNVQDIRWSHKVYRKYHGKLESLTDSRREKLSWEENPEKDLPGRCAIIFTICNNYDALNHLLRKSTDGYKLHKSQEKINYIYMDHIKQLTKNEKQLETLTQAVRIYCEDMRMEFSMGRCGMLIMKSGKQQMTEGIKLTNQEKIRRQGEKETCKLLENIGSSHHQTCGDEKVSLKEFLWRKTKLSKTKLHCRNLITGIYTCAVLLGDTPERISTNGPENKKTYDDA